ncbi:unnamed protein product [Prorocentrum cordatum]|uniref:Uncharacterized protein n=1 Tax=Prorocentrum cordatum TaxID=2364126 RepID=A0ABN9VU99_9DINO|nr:unnamed protein product [Polarella glacialis]
MNCMSNLFALPKCVLSSVDLMAATVILLVIVPLWLAGRFLKSVSLLLGFPLTLLLVPTLIRTRLQPKLSTPPLLHVPEDAADVGAHPRVHVLPGPHGAAADVTEAERRLAVLLADSEQITNHTM